MNDSYDQLLLKMITDNEQFLQQFLGVSSAKLSLYGDISSQKYGDITLL